MFSRSAADAFRSQVIGAKKTGVPIIYLDKCSFMYTRQGDVYIVAVTKQNANPALVFQFIYKMVDVFKAYFGGAFDEESCRQNFVLIYELLDECCDHGYPQITAINILTSYIQVASVKAAAEVRHTHDTGKRHTRASGNVDANAECHISPINLRSPRRRLSLHFVPRSSFLVSRCCRVRV